jgi:transcriptional regulator with XRE-family HTH domain
MEQHGARVFGDTLAALRRRYRMSQHELARAAHLSRAIISIYERGVDPSTGGPPSPRTDTLRQIASGLATNGDGAVDGDLRDQIYSDLMAAAGYLPTVQPSAPWSFERHLRAHGVTEARIQQAQALAAGMSREQLRVFADLLLQHVGESGENPDETKTINEHDEHTRRRHA